MSSGGKHVAVALFRKLAVIFSMTENKTNGEKEGERKREQERQTDWRERFVSGCDESKSGSHWTELRKSVDREDREETEGGGGGGGGGGKGGGGDGGSARCL